MMTLKCLILLTSLFFYQNLSAQNVSVIDGDTLKINNKKIRLFGIDTPEINQLCSKKELQYNCGIEAKEFLVALIKGKQIKCLEKNIKKYGRIIGECFYDDVNINKLLVRSGHALAYRKYSMKYVDDENIAKKEKLGVWSGKFEKPWIWRRKKN